MLFIFPVRVKRTFLVGVLQVFTSVNLLEQLCKFQSIEQLAALALCSLSASHSFPLLVPEAFRDRIG